LNYNSVIYINSMSANKEIVVSTLAEYMEARGMWAGTLERVVIPNLLGVVAMAPTEHAAAESDADIPEGGSAAIKPLVVRPPPIRLAESRYTFAPHT
jgi:hypothetical protein